VFQSPKDLVDCFEALENDGRLDIVAVSNGFLASIKTQELADENTKPTLAPVWKSTNELAGDNVASMARSLYAIEQTHLQKQPRVDGMRRLNFDFHTGQLPTRSRSQSTCCGKESYVTFDLGSGRSSALKDI